MKSVAALFIYLTRKTVSDALVTMPATSVKAIMNGCKKNLVMTLMSMTLSNHG